MLRKKICEYNPIFCEIKYVVWEDKYCDIFFTGLNIYNLER